MAEGERERLLLAAILVRAVRDVVHMDAAAPGAARETAEEAHNWLFEPGGPDAADQLTSFEGICRLLDLDPDRVRNRVRVLLERRAAKMAGRRPPAALDGEVDADTADDEDDEDDDETETGG